MAPTFKVVGRPDQDSEAASSLHDLMCCVDAAELTSVSEFLSSRGLTTVAEVAALDDDDVAQILGLMGAELTVEEQTALRTLRCEAQRQVAGEGEEETRLVSGHTGMKARTARRRSGTRAARKKQSGSGVLGGVGRCVLLTFLFVAGVLGGIFVVNGRSRLAFASIASTSTHQLVSAAAAVELGQSPSEAVASAIEPPALAAAGQPGASANAPSLPLTAGRSGALPPGAAAPGEALSISVVGKAAAPAEAFSAAAVGQAAVRVAAPSAAAPGKAARKPKHAGLTAGKPAARGAAFGQHASKQARGAQEHRGGQSQRFNNLGADGRAHFSQHCQLYPRKRVVLVTVNSEYLVFFKNWLHFAKSHLKSTEQLRVVAEDAGVVASLEEMQKASSQFDLVTPKRELASESEGGVRYGSGAYGDVVWKRPKHLLEVLTANCSVLYADIDTAWAKDPFQVIAHAEYGDLYLVVDNIKVPEESGYCTCFMYMHPTAATRLLMMSWSSSRLSGSKVNQPYFCRTLRNFSAANGLRKVVLPIEQFPPGREAHLYKDAAVFHANWRKGLEKKVRFMKEHHLWNPKGS